MMMQWLVVFLLLCFQALSSEASPLHVGLVSIPCFGHVNPVRAVAAQLLMDGHSVTMITEKPKRAWCEKFEFTKSHRSPYPSEFYFNTNLSDEVLDVKENKLQCVLIDESGRYGPPLWMNLSASDDISSSFGLLFDEMFAYHSEQIGTFLEAIDTVERKFGTLSLILTDFPTIPGQTASKVKSIPMVSLLPLTLNSPLGTATNLPMVGTGLGKHSHMTVFDRVYTWFTRAAFAFLGWVAIYYDVNMALMVATKTASDFFFAGPLELGLMNTLIFVPALPLYDVAQPVCSNVISVGSTSTMSLELLHSRLGDREGLKSVYFDSLTSSDLRFGTFNKTSLASTAISTSLKPMMEGALHAFLSASRSCVQFGAVYVNFGTLSVVSNKTFERIFQSLLEVNFCVVWKISEEQRFKAVMSAVHSKGEAERFYVVPGSGFKSPPAIMTHPNTKVFISHCGDTSVLEAIEAQLPVAGIPMFADQQDVCQRVHESNIGIYVGPKHKFKSTHLTSVLKDLGVDGRKREVALNALARVRHGSRHFGGARRVAQHIELNFESGVMSPDPLTVPFFKSESRPNVTYFYHPFACSCIHPRYLSAFDDTPINKLKGGVETPIPLLRPSNVILIHNLDVAAFAISGCVLVLYVLKWSVLRLLCLSGCDTISNNNSVDFVSEKRGVPLMVQQASLLPYVTEINLRVKACKPL